MTKEFLPNPNEPKEAISWAIKNINKVALITSLGKQTTIIIDIMHKMGVSIPIHMIDTGLLFEETHALKKELEAKYNINILTIRTDIDLEDQSVMYGPNLWYRNPNLCCNIRKVKPLNGLLKSYSAWITGIRRDQSDTRKDIKTIEFDCLHDMIKVNPLAYWSLEDVDNYIDKEGVPYNKAFDDGYRSIGCMPCTNKNGCGERGGRWAGLAKTECGIHNYKGEGK